MPLNDSKKLSVYVQQLTATHFCPPSDARQLPEITHIWGQCAGDVLASHAKIISYRDGRLTLYADSSAWLSRIFHQRQSLLQCLRKHVLLSSLKDIAASVMPFRPALSPVRPTAPALPGLSSATSAFIAQYANSVADPNLQHALRNLAQRIKMPKEPK